MPFLLLLACSAGPEPDPGGVVSLGASPVGGLGPSNFTAVTTDAAGVLVGTDHGLYRGTSPDGALTLLAGPELAGRIVTALTAFDGAILVASVENTLEHAGTMLRSDDGGATWTDVSAGLGTLQSAQFASHADRLVFDGDATAYDWDAATASWAPIVDDVTFVPPDRVGFDGDRLLVDDAYGTGVYEQDPVTRTFRPVEGLSAWGYTAFAEGNQAVTANGQTIFVEDGDAWGVALDDPDQSGIALDLFASGDVVLAAGMSALRRSDGATWTELAVATTSDEAFAGDDARVWWIGTDALRSSANLGVSWEVNPSELAVADQVLVGSGSVYAVPHATDGSLTYPVMGADDDVFSEVATEVSSVATTATDLWTCTASECTRAPHDGSAGAALGVPAASFLGDRLHASADDVFFDVPVDGCDGHAPLALWRFDAAEWAAVGEGLPSEGDGDCASPRYADRYLWIDAWSVAEGVLFADVAHAGTWRSADDGESWEPLDVRIVQAAACRGAIVVLTDDGDLLRSTDAGETFAEVETGLEGAEALATWGDRCVLGLRRFDGGATVLVSTDGIAFAPTDFTEPVLGLAADDGTLAVSTASNGVYRAE